MTMPSTGILAAFSAQYPARAWTMLGSHALAATVTPSDPMVIMFTSGSSGPPKGVAHSHGNALGAVRSGLASRCIDSDTRLYLPMPFFWVGEFASGVLSAPLAGATLVTEKAPSPTPRCVCWNASE